MVSPRTRSDVAGKSFTKFNTFPKVTFSSIFPQRFWYVYKNHYGLAFIRENYPSFLLNSLKGTVVKSGKHERNGKNEDIGSVSAQIILLNFSVTLISVVSIGILTDV